MKNTYYILVSLYLFFCLFVTFFSVNFLNDLKSFTNKSHSMNPSINEGSVIIVKRSEVYQPGDIISYYGKIDGKETIITHRIMRIGGNVYLTKGDANQAYDDKIILPRLVIGRVIFIIPYIGYILSFAKNGLGLWLSVLLPAFVIIIIELIKVFDELSRKKFIHKK